MPRQFENVSPLYSPDTTAEQCSDIELVFVDPPRLQHRFRYLSELQGTPHGPLMGIKSTKTNKTFPEVQLKGYSGTAIIRCWLVDCQKDNQIRPHIHGLAVKSKKDKKDIRYDPHSSVACSSNDYKVSFEDMVILRAVTRNQSTKTNFIQKMAHWNSRFDHRSCESISSSSHQMSLQEIQMTMKTISKNIVYLYFEAVIETSEGYRLLASLLSEPIKDMKDRQSGELKILDQSLSSGSVEGGDTVFIFTSNLPSQFKIDFFDDRGWEDIAEFQLSDIHQHCAVKFKTPPHPEGGKAFFRIIRETDYAESNICTFEYLNPSIVHTFIPSIELSNISSNNVSRRRKANQEIDDYNGACKNKSKYQKMDNAIDELLDQYLSPEGKVKIEKTLTGNVEESLFDIDANDLINEGEIPSHSLSFNSSDAERELKYLRELTEEPPQNPEMPEHIVEIDGVHNENDENLDHNSERKHMKKEKDKDDFIECSFIEGQELQFSDQRVFSILPFIFKKGIERHRGKILLILIVGFLLYEVFLNYVNIHSIVLLITVVICKYMYPQAVAIYLNIKSKVTSSDYLRFFIIVCCFIYCNIITTLLVVIISLLLFPVNYKLPGSTDTPRSNLKLPGSQSLFLMAFYDRDLDKMKQTWDNKYSSQEVIKKCLVVAVQLRWVQGLEFLIKCCKFSPAAISVGPTFLIHIAAASTPECLKCILSNSSLHALSLLNADGETALHVACKRKQMDNFEIIFEAAKAGGLLGKICQLVDREGNTLLHTIVLNKHSAVKIEEIIKDGAVVDQENLRGLAPLHLAVINKNYKAALALINDHQVSVDLTDFNQKIGPYLEKEHSFSSHNELLDWCNVGFKQNDFQKISSEDLAERIKEEDWQEYCHEHGLSFLISHLKDYKNPRLVIANYLLSNELPL